MSGAPDRREPEHLGDAVYVAHDGYQLWLRANDIDWDKPAYRTGDIALEPEVLLALIDYAVRVGLLQKEKQ